MENQLKPTQDKGRNAGRWVIGIMVVGCSLMAIFFYQALKRAPEYKSLVTEQMSMEFISYATTLKATQQLKVAELNQVEVFERTSSLSLFWNQIKLPDLVVGITTPVHFSYVIDMKGAWKFEIQDQLLVVTAPPLSPETPSPDLSATKFEVKKGSVFRNEKAALESLKKDITPLLAQRALENEPLIQETAKKSVEDFVMVWLMDKFHKDKDLKVEVRFASAAPAPIPAK